MGFNDKTRLKSQILIRPKRLKWTYLSQFFGDLGFLHESMQ